MLWTLTLLQSYCLWLFICTLGIPSLDFLKNLLKWFMLVDFILLFEFSFNKTLLHFLCVCDWFLVSIHFALKGFGLTSRIYPHWSFLKLLIIVSLQLMFYLNFEFYSSHGFTVHEFWVIYEIKVLFCIFICHRRKKSSF